MEIQIKQDELIPKFNSKFSKTLMDIPEICRPHDLICLVVYLGALGQKMGFLLRDKQPQSLCQDFEFSMDIECNMKYGVIRRCTSTGLHFQNEVNNQEKDEQHQCFHSRINCIGQNDVCESGMNVAAKDVVDEELETFSANEGNKLSRIVESTSFPLHT